MLGLHHDGQTYNPNMSLETFQKQAARLSTSPETWELLSATGPDYWGEGVSQVQSYVMFLVSSDGPIVAAQASDEPPTASMLSMFVTMTCLAPSNGEPRRPDRLVTADNSAATELSAELRAVGISIQHGATPNATQAYESMLRFVTAPTVADSLTNADDDAVRAYFRAAEEFYRSRPWEALATEKFVAFRLEGRPWRYVSVMGEGSMSDGGMGDGSTTDDSEEYGFAVYDDWLDACRMAYAHFPIVGEEWTDDAPNPFEVIYGFESFSLYPLDVASPADVEAITRLGIRKTCRGQFALVQRHTFEGAEPAINALETYTAVMQVLSARADRARGRKVSSIKAQMDTVHGVVQVVYPANGSEDASASHYYQVEFSDTWPRRDGSGPIPCRARAVVPAATKWPKLISAVRAAAREAGYLDPYLDTLVETAGMANLWRGHGSAVEPSPTVEQLAALDSVSTGFGNHLHPVSITHATAPAGSALSAHWTELATDRLAN